MSTEYDKRVEEWSAWFFEHKVDGGDVPQQVQFLKKAVEGLLELLAHAANDIRALEGRPKHTLGTPLYLPGQMNIRGNLTRFG